MKKCVSTAIDKAASAAAIVPAPTFGQDWLWTLKRCGTAADCAFGGQNQVPGSGIDLG